MWKRAFTLVEILVAIVIMSFILVSGISMTVHYIYDMNWDRLFDRLERQFLDINAFALAGFSAAYVESGDDVKELPEMYHMYMESMEDEFGVWYFESRLKDGATSDDQRWITYQKYFDLDVSPIILEKVVLQEGPTLESGPQITDNNVLISWANPFSQLSFRMYSSQLLKTGDDLKQGFTLNPERLGCKDYPKVCALTLYFIRPESLSRKDVVLQAKTLTFDLQKGIYRDFVN